MAQTFHVDVFSLNTKVFSGEVQAISSSNALGPFDILDLHSNFISTIEKQLTLHLENGTKTEIPLESGILRCLNTHVSIFIAKTNALA